MARTAQVLHLSESPNDSFLLKAELAEEGIPCQLLSLTPGEDLARAVKGSTIDLMVVDVPLTSPQWRASLEDIQRSRPELPVVFRWGGTGNWSTESSTEQIGRRIRGVLSLPDTLKRTDGDRREFMDRLVRHQQTYLELLRSDFWDFEDAIRRIIVRAADLLEIERVSVWEFTEDRKAIVCDDLFVRSTRAHEKPRPVSSCPKYLATLESSLTLAADEAQTDPRTSELADSYLIPHGVVAMLDAPIRRDGRLVGVVCHEHIGSPRQWTVLEQCSAGWVAGLVARAMDVRERRQLSERLERAERLDSIGRLAGGLAHDFNNCLTAILGHVEDGLAGNDTASRTALHGIKEVALSASKLSKELLTAGRAEPVSLVPIDVAALIKGMTPKLQPLLPKQARLEVLPTAEPVWIRGDAGALERVIVNMVSNAADAVATSGSYVRVRLMRTPAFSSGAPVPAAASAAIEIADDGIGMDATVQARLFEPFFTTKGAVQTAGARGGGGSIAPPPSTRPRSSGAGLGLATAFGIVRQHGGTITVESAPRQGSRFTVLIPTMPPPA
jgi:signal transduction histidine kinase